MSKKLLSVYGLKLWKIDSQDIAPFVPYLNIRIQALLSLLKLECNGKGNLAACDG